MVTNFCDPKIDLDLGPSSSIPSNDDDDDDDSGDDVAVPLQPSAFSVAEPARAQNSAATIAITEKVHEYVVSVMFNFGEKAIGVPQNAPLRKDILKL